MGVTPSIGGGGADTSLEEIVTAGLGVQSWSFPWFCTNAGTAMASGTIYAVAVALRPGTYSSVWLSIETAASGTTPTGVFLGIADKTGKLLGQSANLNAGSYATGVRAYTIGATAIPAPDLYYVVALVNGTWSVTQTTFSRARTPNVGQFGSVFSYATGGAGQTALPANGSSVTLATTSTPIPFWLGVS